ncbi:hypothetical protein LDENG_00287880 [Lucifuga dentata]|nr:hypothetical protein LDENG_00287880 [Lucifuga dentata]
MEGQRLFYTLTVTDEKYETASEAIQSFFLPKVNIVAERYHFRQRGQCAGETTDQYVAALKELITTCEFGTMEEEMIRDQLVEKTNSSHIRERLLLEVPLTLTKAMTIAQHIETAVAEAKAMVLEPWTARCTQFNQRDRSNMASLKKDNVNHTHLHSQHKVKHIQMWIYTAYC